MPIFYLLQDTLEEFTSSPPPEYREEHRHLIMTDCHYYFPSHSFTSFNYGLVYTVGLQFHNVPGSYRLPFSEGSYVLTP